MSAFLYFIVKHVVFRSILASNKKNILPLPWYNQEYAVNKKMTNTFKLIREVRHLRKIAGKRHPMYDQNKFAKYLIGFSLALGVVYLILFGVLFISLFREIFPSMEPYHIFNKGMFYLLMADFLMRFTMTKLPVQEIKPFILLPIGKNRVLRSYLILTGMSGYNLIPFKNCSNLYTVRPILWSEILP